MCKRYQDIWEMPFGGKSSDKQAPHWFGNFCWGFINLIFKPCFRWTITNREQLRAFDNKVGVVLVSNHTSYLDTCFIFLTARLQQWVRLLGKDDLFTNLHGLIGHILSRAGAIPIKRDTADKAGIKRAVRWLKDGEIVGIFPEGTRRGKVDRVPVIYAGAPFLAKMADVPMLPMTVRDAENIKHKGERFRFPKVTVEIGYPILVSDFDFIPKADRNDAAAWYVMRECFALSKRVSRDEVDMEELFPGQPQWGHYFEGVELPHHDAFEYVADRLKKEAEQAATKAAAKAEDAAAVDDVTQSAAKLGQTAAKAEVSCE